ncbi:SGNH/GDSL hydrolase family protein [Acinetobacter sp. NIPH 1852]|uniref:SGNH/GDSL hydrolase family protein n=1 Tax=Acinetobacter sp. NIPH 1852 TaxID=2923428 RepID=UPI001F4A34F0|nr:SGNH/GDSL hydrolase family protein [Acinetobacter sp. NIPH 1852]MCH7307834.1 SGNH/GDSL hydrolase family protein [Acinetobacter sp. NIPH 1852]
MAVPEQMPIVSYIANGTTTNFTITFDLHDDRYLIVTVNKEVPPFGSYTVANGEVVFSTPPNQGDEVTLARDTVLDRDTNYQSYDNSFRPEAVNYDFDKIWHVLQEQNLIDAKLLARLKEEIEWRRTHDFNYDELAQVREKQLFDALKGYTDTLLASTNPGVFQGVVAGVVFASDGKSIQTHIEDILLSLGSNSENIDLKADQIYVNEQLQLKQQQIDTKADKTTTTLLQQEKANLSYVDSALASFQGGAFKAYPTLALANADIANIALNTKVDVLSTTDGGSYYKASADATSLTKSPYDPLNAAKSYTDSQVRTTDVSSGNLALNPVATYTGQGLGSTGVFQTSSNLNSIAIAVTENSIISLLNDRGAYTGGAIGVYHSALPPTAENKIANFTVINRTNDQSTYVVSAVPVGAKYLIVNSKSTTDIIWNIQKGAYLDLNKAGKKSLISLNDKIVFDLDVDTTIKNEGNLNQPKSVLQNTYVNSRGAVISGAGFKTLLFPVVEGATYYITDTVGSFNGSMRSVFATSELFSSALPPIIEYKQTSVDTIKKFTVPKGLGIKFVFLTLKTGAFDVENSLVIHRWRNTDFVAKESISKIKGKTLIDETARTVIDAIDQSAVTSRFANKKFLCFGDSITQGTEGGYVKYVEGVLRCEITNKGSSGARVYRVVDIATRLSAFRDPNTKVAYPEIDYMQFAGVSIMIGTNDSTSGITGSLADIPTDSVFDHVGSEVTGYFDLFPNTYYGNLALVIEWIRWKNPLCEIYLISGPRKGSNFAEMDSVVNAVKEIAKHYSLPFINATHESGITHKFWSNYSYDLTHMNATGNKVLGNFIGRRILNS